ncbi:MAG: hypothetical protein R3Y49_04180 [Rikenellaceae bacterium]
MNARRRLFSSATLGFRSGLKTWWWIAKIMVLVTFIVVMLEWSGFLGVLSEWLTPVLEPVGLTSNGVFIFITTALANIYAGIGVMATLAVDFKEAVILGVMGLICHNMIVETVIQSKSGASAWGMVLLRVFGAVAVGYAMNLMIAEDYAGVLIIEPSDVDHTNFGAMTTEWALSMARMVPVMFCVIVGLNVVQQVLREFSVINLLSKPFVWIMAIFGLRRDSALIWLILNTLGLAYGGSIMIAERDNGDLSLRESKLLNTHIAASHSLLEDTMLYVAIGLPLFWMMVPRLILAIVAVWFYRLVLYFRG